MRGKAILLLGGILALAPAACSPERSRNAGTEMPMDEMMSDEGMMDGMMGDMMGDMMGPGMMRDMRAIHGLLINHEAITRHVEDIPKGVRTETTSDDPEMARLIRAHVQQMKERYARGQPIRMMDPVFRELFRNRGKAVLEYEALPNGVRVIHTSNDPQIVLLIRQHARHFVSEAAEEGMSRAMRPTPLPEGYRGGAG